MRDTKAIRSARYFQSLAAMGISYHDADKIRLIQMTLHRWDEMECGDEHGRCIERDEQTGKPYLTFDSGPNGKRGRTPIADREGGALKRLGKIMAAYPHLAAYHQSDCRGCGLYIVKRKDLEGDEIVREAKAQGCVITMTKAEGFPLKATYSIAECVDGFDCPEAAALRWFRIKGIKAPSSRNLPIESYYTRGVACCI